MLEDLNLTEMADVSTPDDPLSLGGTSELETDPPPWSPPYEKIKNDSRSTYYTDCNGENKLKGKPETGDYTNFICMVKM